MRLRYTVPNGFTSLSLLLGVASIVTTQLGDLETAAWIIVWCGLLDVMDGVSARLLKATSDFGAEFDSMADLVSFGVAPAVLMLNAGLQIGGIEAGSPQFVLVTGEAGVGKTRLAAEVGLAVAEAMHEVTKDDGAKRAPSASSGLQYVAASRLFFAHIQNLWADAHSYVLSPLRG